MPAPPARLGARRTGAGRLARPAPAPRRRPNAAAAPAAPAGPRPSPPPDFDVRAATLATSREVISQRWPELLDLVEDGTLVAIPRPPDYAERRTDNFVEPGVVLLVATAHVTRSSADRAARVVTRVAPDAVVVELCRSRTGVLVDTGAGGGDDGGPSSPAPPPNNPFSVAGPLTRTLRLSGGNPASLLLRLALARAAASAASAIDGGVPPGADARAAATAAKAVGATVVLGDRPIEITLRRAWEGTTWRERAAVVRLLGSDAPPAIATPPSSPSTVAAVEALAADPASLAALAASLTSAAPSLGAALLDERDEWIAWSLARSRAVSGADAVVGVFGAGHVRGVAWQLLTRQGDGRPRFKELAGVGEGSARALAQRVGVEFVVGTAVAAAAAAWWSLG